MIQSRLSDRIADYLRRLVITQGRHAGKPFEVLPWQRRFIRGAFAPGIGEAALSLGRGGGKSCLIAGIGCAALDTDGPLMKPNAEVVIAASSHAQGGVIFRHVMRFLAEGIDLGLYRRQDNVNMSTLQNRLTGTMLAVKGSDPKRLHGMAPSLTLADELSQWPQPRIAEMMAALRTAAGKIEDSRLLMIGTRPADEGHPFAVALRDSDYCQVHAALKEDPPFQLRTWRKANPGLDHFPDLLKAIRREAKAAKADDALLPSFEALRLNLGTSDVGVAVLINAATWEKQEADAARLGEAVWGLDLGTSAAQCAVAAYWPETGRLECMAAFPGIPSLAERGLRDGVGDLYRRMARRGELIQTGGHAADIAELLIAARARFGVPRGIVCDRWRIAELCDAMAKADIDCTVVRRGMGFKDGAEDVRGLRRALLEIAMLACPFASAAPCHGRGARCHGSGRQSETCETHRRRAPYASPR